MSDRPEPRAKSAGVAIVAVALVVLFILLPTLYCLSLGPAVWLAVHGYIEKPAVEAVYSPVKQLADAFPPFDHAVRRYLNLWR